jgi:hypothetical protein
MIQEGRTAFQIADVLDVNPETIHKFCRNRGLTIQKVDVFLENSRAWKGGKTLDRSGYILQRVPKDGEHGYLIRAIAKRGALGTDKAGYAPVHRIVMHNLIGRRLLKGEVVDHIDGDITNNDPDNLRLYPSNADHLRETLKGKIPKWTPEGKSRLIGRPRKTQQQESRL